MKKVALVVALVLGFALVGAGTASAKDMGGRFGVGADSNLGWSTGTIPAAGAGSLELAVPGTGLSIIYNVSKMFGLQLIIGAGFTSASDDAADYSSSAFGVAVRGIIPVAFTNDVNLGAVVGFSFMNSSVEYTPDGGDTTDGSASFISFDLGLRPEWFITEHFSIHTQVGVAVSLLGEGSGALVAPFGEDSGGGGIAFDLFHNADLLGDAGFTFYF